jgi:quinol monooxygenase YgiN
LESEVATIFILHRVADYDAWRQVYDDVAPMQQAGGVIEEHVYRAKGDPNNVLVMHRFTSIEQADAFAAKPELRAAMQRGGVEGPPRIEFYEEA